MNADGWDWSTFRGTKECLHWNRRDLESLELALRLVRQRRAVVQAGGNLGIFPKYLASRFHVVYTFEPAPDLFLHLCHNAPETNIVRFQCGLGAHAGFVTLERFNRTRPGVPHEGTTHISGPGPLPVITLDSLQLEQMDCIDLLYLDVEGWELFALRGARRLLARSRPVIGVEVNRNLEIAGCSQEELADFLMSMGYTRAGSHRSDEFWVPVTGSE